MTLYSNQRVVATKASDVVAGGGTISVDVEGEHRYAPGDRLLPDKTVFYFWFRVGGPRATLTFKTAWDVLYGCVEVSRFEAKARGLALATAAAEAVFAKIRAATPKYVPSDYEREKASLRKEARQSPAIADAVLGFLGNVTRCGKACSVALMREYIAQHSAGNGAFGALSKSDQMDVIRAILDKLVKDGRAERMIGLGDRGGEAHVYVVR